MWVSTKTPLAKGQKDQLQKAKWPKRPNWPRSSIFCQNRQTLQNPKKFNIKDVKHSSFDTETHKKAYDERHKLWRRRQTHNLTFCGWVRTNPHHFFVHKPLFCLPTLTYSQNFCLLRPNVLHPSTLMCTQNTQPSPRSPEEQITFFYLI
jgi:hypothetical protein